MSVYFASIAGCTTHGTRPLMEQDAVHLLASCGYLCDKKFLKTGMLVIALMLVQWCQSLFERVNEKSDISTSVCFGIAVEHAEMSI